MLSLSRRLAKKPPVIMFPETALPMAYEDILQDAPKNKFKSKTEMEKSRKRAQGKIYSNKNGDPWYQ